MKIRVDRIWSPEDTDNLRLAMARHPAYAALQFEHAVQAGDLAPVVDITTRERLA